MKTWRERAGVTFARQDRQPEVPATGHTVLAAKEATDLGLMPAALAVRPDFTIAYRLPAGTEGTLRNEPISWPPDASAFLTRLARPVAPPNELIQRSASNWHCVPLVSRGHYR